MKPVYSIVKLMLVIFAAATIGGCLNNPKRDRYLIPHDFVGTVYVHYNVPTAKPLTMEDGYRLVIIPYSGIVHTSSDLMGGKFHDEYWLVNGDKRVMMSPYKLGGGWTEQQEGHQEITSIFRVLKEERPHDTFWSTLTWSPKVDPTPCQQKE